MESRRKFLSVNLEISKAGESKLHTPKIQRTLSSKTYTHVTEFSVQPTCKIRSTRNFVKPFFLILFS